MNFEWVTGFFVPYINFAIFLFLAFKLFKGPLLGLLQGKKREYEKKLKAFSLAKEEAAARNDGLTKRLADLDRELADMEKAAKRDAEIEGEKILAEARKLSEFIVSEARRLAAAEVEKAKKEINEEILRRVREQVFAKAEQAMSQDHLKQSQSEAISQLKQLNFES